MGCCMDPYSPFLFPKDWVFAVDAATLNTVTEHSVFSLGCHASIIHGIPVLGYMAFILPTKETWNTYTTEEKKEIARQLFIARSTEADPWPVGNLGLTLEEYQHTVLGYYRLAGFPHYDMDEREKIQKFDSLLRYDHSKVFKDGIVNQTMHGLGLAWCYFPHMWKVQCNGMRTPFEVFSDDSLFMKAIVKRMKWGTYISDSGIRKGLRSYSGTQCVSNFRPTAAASVYLRYLPESGGVTWDMSSGFGGRLLGAMSCSRVRRYIGTDPCSETMDGLLKMKAELTPWLYKLQPTRPEIAIELHKIGSEDYAPEPESIDCCFTSPPYAGHEKYNDEDTQSYLKFPSQSAWLNEFMRRTLLNCHKGLKSTGHLVVNIAGVKGYPKLNHDFHALALTCGFELEEAAVLNLSRMMGTRTAGGVKKEGSYKTEPVFVFRKR